MVRKRDFALDEQDRELLIHVHSLGLNTVDEYREWCAQNGFSRKLNKDWKQRCREGNLVKHAIVRERLDRRKREQRKPGDLYQDICERRLSEADVTQPHLKRLCQVIQTGGSKDEPADLQQLLNLLRHLDRFRVDLTNLSPVISELGFQTGNSLIEAIVLISAHRSAWLRPLEAWKPRTHNARRRFASLLRHLFVRYDDMPQFFDSVWFANRTVLHSQHRKWFLQVGGGASIRLCSLPIPLTKRMAHNFMQAPNNLTVEKALRWSQVLGLGGDERLAQAIIATRLGEAFVHDDFWVTVIEWFIAHPMLGRNHVGPIIDYLRHQRFGEELQNFAPGTAEPPQPNLTMKGRTPGVLLRNVNQWHAKLAKENTHLVADWTPMSIDAFDFIEGSQTNGTLKIWTIRELLSSKALVTEGREMKHCVATYVNVCKGRYTSIWRMEVETFEGSRKALTIEIRNQQRQICQARGKANRRASEKELGILRRWASQAGLSVAAHL